MINKNESYQEVVMDNPHCNRRFHIYFDPTAQPQKETAVKCPICQAHILVKKNHPKISLAREENLVNSPDGSNQFMKDCFLVRK